MKNNQQARFTGLPLLLLAIIFLFAVNPSVSSAQSKAPSLEGTEWAWVLPVDYGTGNLYCFYRFEEGQQVARRVVAIVRDRLQLGIDKDRLLFYGTHTLTMNHIPAGISVKERAGRYSQNGNSLTLKFSDSAEALVLTYNNDKDTWSATNGMPDISRIRPAPIRAPKRPVGSESAHPNVVKNSDGTLRPASGYQWVKPQAQNDFRVERIP